MLFSLTEEPGLYLKLQPNVQESKREVDIKMAIPIETGVTVSTAAYTKSANLMTGRNQFLQKGRLMVVALQSAIGMNVSFSVGGVPLMDDKPLPNFGTTGTMNVKDHVIIDQVIAGGTAEMYIRNTTVGALTTDYLVFFTPM